MIHGRRNTDISDEPIDKLIASSNSEEIKALCLFTKKVSGVLLNVDDNIHCVKDSVDHLLFEMKQLKDQMHKADLTNSNDITSLKYELKVINLESKRWLKILSIALTLVTGIGGYIFKEFKTLYTTVTILEHQLKVK